MSCEACRIASEDVPKGMCLPCYGKMMDGFAAKRAELAAECEHQRKEWGQCPDDYRGHCPCWWTADKECHWCGAASASKEVAS